jgi:hypothetical protein
LSASLSVSLCMPRPIVRHVAPPLAVVSTRFVPFHAVVASCLSPALSLRAGFIARVHCVFNTLCVVLAACGPYRTTPGSCRVRVCTLLCALELAVARTTCPPPSRHVQPPPPPHKQATCSSAVKCSRRGASGSSCCAAAGSSTPRTLARKLRARCAVSALQRRGGLRHQTPHIVAVTLLASHHTDTHTRTHRHGEEQCCCMHCAIGSAHRLFSLSPSRLPPSDPTLPRHLG